MSAHALSAHAAKPGEKLVPVTASLHTLFRNPSLHLLNQAIQTINNYSCLPYRDRHDLRTVQNLTD